MAARSTPTDILLTSDQIQARVRALAAEIERDSPPDDPLHLICVLKGTFVFFADLVRAIARPVTVDFIAVASYGDATSSSGEVRLTKDLDAPIEGRDVLIVEDIIDTGRTLIYLQEILRARAPKRLRTVCLLAKPARRIADVRIDYTGFAIEDRFVVGYGLDCGEAYRQLPHVAAIDA